MNRMILFKRKGLLETHIAVLLFGITGLFGKLLLLPPDFIVIGRAIFAGIALMLVSLYLRQSFQIKTKQDALLFVVSGIFLACHWWSFFYSIQISTIAIGLLTFSTFPIFITFMEPYFFGEKIRAFDVATAISVSIGLILVVPVFDFSNNVTKGVFWGVVSGFTCAVLALCNRKNVREYPPLIIVCYQNLIAALVLIPIAFSHSVIFSIHDLLLLFVLGIFCTGNSTVFIHSWIVLHQGTARKHYCWARTGLRDHLGNHFFQ